MLPPRDPCPYPLNPAEQGYKRALLMKSWSVGRGFLEAMALANNAHDTRLFHVMLRKDPKPETVECLCIVHAGALSGQPWLEALTLLLGSYTPKPYTLNPRARPETSDFAAPSATSQDAEGPYPNPEP